MQSAARAVSTLFFLNLCARGSEWCRVMPGRDRRTRPQHIGVYALVDRDQTPP